MDCSCTNSTSAAQYLFILVPLALGFICFKAAANKGRNRWFWGVVGFFTPLLGLIFMAVLPKITPREDAV